MIVVVVVVVWAAVQSNSTICIYLFFTGVLERSSTYAVQVLVPVAVVVVVIVVVAVVLYECLR